MRYSQDFSDQLLGWYDRHARQMPWRVSPADRAAGVLPDPYRVWLSEVMLQQTTVAAVGKYFQAFTSRWPRVSDLAAAQDDDVMAAWAGLGYYARARNLLKCARVVAGEHGGKFPQTYAELLALPGIGPYTAAAIAAIAFDERAVVVDGNVERVMARFFRIETPLPGAKPELVAAADALTPDNRAGDYAQAVMDLGATICTPKSPTCALCPVNAGCQGFADGIATDLPLREPKKPKPTRFGIAYLARREDGAWLLERRPEKGLLGGMWGWPGTDWSTDDNPTPAPPIEADWQALSGEVRHTFTHFHLRLTLNIATVDTGAVPTTGEFRAPDQFSPTALPTLMRKAYDLAEPEFARIDC